MNIKTYEANTYVSINIVLPSKKNLHITFTPLSNGSSTYSTENEDIQKGIERHYNFGKLFRLINTKSISNKARFQGKETSQEVISEDCEISDQAKSVEDSEDINVGNEVDVTIIKVTDLSAAKDYLADKFGISRTVLRSKKAIVDHAAANMIKFEGLD